LVGLNVEVPVARIVPPEAKSYQSTVNPDGTEAEIEAIEPLAQYVLLPPLTGGATVGQPQVGAVTASVLLQDGASADNPAVKVMFVPAGIPETDQLLPPLFKTVPAVLVSVPTLKLTLKDQVERSVEQAG
jgi:hypothetical protein